MKFSNQIIAALLAICLLSSCDGPTAEVFAEQLIQLTLYYGQHIAESAAAKTVEKVFDQLFTPGNPGLKIRINGRNPNRAVAEKLTFKRENPACDLEIDNVPLNWDNVQGKWRPDAAVMQHAQASCEVQ